MITFWVILGFIFLCACFCVGMMVGSRGWRVGTEMASFDNWWDIGPHIEWDKGLRYGVGISLGPRCFSLVFKSPKLKE